MKINSEVLEFSGYGRSVGRLVGGSRLDALQGCNGICKRGEDNVTMHLCTSILSVEFSCCLQGFLQVCRMFWGVGLHPAVSQVVFCYSATRFVNYVCVYIYIYI